jgi:hypothetical protein
LRAEGFFCNLDILYGGLGIGKLQFFIKKIKFFFSCNFFIKFLVIKALDPDWIRIWIRIGVHPKMPDPDEMNTDPQPWLKLLIVSSIILFVKGIVSQDEYFSRLIIIKRCFLYMR